MRKTHGGAKTAVRVRRQRAATTRIRMYAPFARSGINAIRQLV